MNMASTTTPTPPPVDEHQDQDITEVLTDVDTVVRAELVRVDAKASGLFQGFGLVLAAAGLITGIGGRTEGLPAALVVLGWGVTACLAVAVALAALAMRPRIRPTGGRYGQLIYTPGSAADLIDRARTLATDTVAAQSTETAAVGASLRRKFALVRAAIDIAVWGPAATCLTAGIVFLMP